MSGHETPTPVLGWFPHYGPLPPCSAPGACGCLEGACYELGMRDQGAQAPGAFPTHPSCRSWATSSFKVSFSSRSRVTSLAAKTLVSEGLGPHSPGEDPSLSCPSRA